MNREEALKRTILLFEYGSQAYGVSTKSSDHDLMGILVEPKEYVLGLKRFDQYQTSKTERSTAEDTDETIYGLRKWAALAAKGNPTVQLGLFASSYEVKTEAGQLLLDNRDAFLSKEAGRRYLGYMQSQVLALTGQKNKRTNRPELIEQFGIDTKFAYHAVRLGLQGCELMREGQIHLPMKDHNVRYLQSVRSGQVSLPALLGRISRIEGILLDEIEKSSLPDVSDYDRVNTLLAEIYETTWNANAD